MKKTLRLFIRFQLGIRLLIRLMYSALVLQVLPAHAYTCGFENLFYENLSIPVVGPGMSTIGEDIPVGQVIYTSRFMGNNRRTGFYCSITTEDIDAGESNQTMNVYNRVDIIATPSGAPTTSGDKFIFPTNVPGIGVIFYVTGSSFRNTTFPAIWERTFQIGHGTTTQGLGQVSIVEFELIKTGPIAPGTHQVLGSSFPSFQISSGSNSPTVINHVFVTLSFSGAITMYTKTCQLATSVMDVDLGAHQRSDFTGVGSTTPWTEFDIVLRDCPAFVGYGNHTYQETTGVTTGTSTPNQVALTFNSVHGVVDSNPLLAKLESGPTAAAGIGIELSERNSATSLNLDGSGAFSLQNLPTVDGSSYTIPLKARYVQYESDVKAGMANGAAVFTITYN
ncbi:fimbrial protein [Enterobacter cancerogenus]|nr:fimbrial protein [Enterobacter cancerogenus]